MTVELISVGTEILMGNIVNTNAAYLAKECAGLGLSLYYQTVTGDNEARLQSTIQTALERSDVIILTGGLGPTEDDLTKETVAKALGREIVEDAEAKNQIKAYFKKMNRTSISDNNWKQAYVIEGCNVLYNDNGTAPGMLVETENNKTAILLPGPPNEMKPMFEQYIIPYFQKKQPKVFYSEMVKLCGIGESMAETKILDLIDNQTNPTIAPYAKTGEVHFRVTASADTIEEGKELVAPVVAELEKRFGDCIYTRNEEETLESVIVSMLADKNLTISTAESITGGMIGSTLVNVPGASAVYNEGFITYSNEAKEKHLGVSHDTLLSYGAVSEQTAYEMAEGLCKRTGADIGIAVTGIAGPDGGTAEKPVGLVYIGCCCKEKVTVEKYIFMGNRQKVRDTTVVRALDLVRRSILAL